jgi:hypothetical protein
VSAWLMSDEGLLSFTSLPMSMKPGEGWHVMEDTPAGIWRPHGPVPNPRPILRPAFLHVCPEALREGTHKDQQPEGGKRFLQP